MDHNHTIIKEGHIRIIPAKFGKNQPVLFEAIVDDGHPKRPQ